MGFNGIAWDFVMKKLNGDLIIFNPPKYEIACDP
jgi:hypothetical protein